MATAWRQPGRGVVVGGGGAYQPAPSPQPSPTLKDASLSKSPPNRLIGPSPLPPPSIFIVLVLAAIDRGTGATAPGRGEVGGCGGAR